MSDSPPTFDPRRADAALPPAPARLIDPAAAIRADRCRTAAEALRRAADEVGSVAADVAPFHRPDVWEGAVPSRFGDDLDHWRRRLGDPGDGLGLRAELRAVADRLEGRAHAIEAQLDDAGAGIGVDGAAGRVGSGADDAFWWGRRG